MKYFTKDNTEGFTQKQLDSMNQELERQLEDSPFRDDDLCYESDVKNLAGKISDEFSEEPENDINRLAYNIDLNGNWTKVPN